MMLLTKSITFIPVYEGENEGEGNNPPPKTFTQEQVNEMLAADKRKHKAQVDKAVLELENIKKSKGLTDQEKESLQARIETLNNELLTKEELAANEKKKLETEYTKTLQTEKEEKDFYRSLYERKDIERTISDSAMRHKAFSAEQIVEFLKHRTKMIEERDGTGTRTFTPRVKFDTHDKDGKPITLDLSVEEAVKRMKDLPERFGNLFESAVNGGLGGSGTGTSGGRKALDFKNMSMEEHKKIRSTLRGK